MTQIGNPGTDDGATVRLLRARFRLDMIVTAAVLVTCGVVISANWSRMFPLPPRTPVLPKAPVSIEGAALKGDPRAPVVLIEWSDYECPYCGKAEREVLPDLEKQYIATGKVQLAYFQLPLEPLHPHARKAAEAAVCAAGQGRFWEMHAALFGDQRKLDDASILDRAGQLSIDPKQFASCLGGSDVAQIIQHHQKQAEALGLTGTPAFLIGRRQPDGLVKVIAIWVGSGSVSQFRAAFELAARP